MRVPELMQKRAVIADSIKTLLDKVSSENRTSVNAEEQVKLDAMEADLKGLNDLIERERRSELLQAQIGGNPRVPETSRDERIIRQEAQRRDEATAGWLRGGYGRLADEHRALLPRGDFGGADSVLLRAAAPLSDVTGALGQYTVPTGFYTVLTEAMKWYGGIRASRATILRTATGNALPMPSVNDTTNTGELIAESTIVTQAVTEMAFAQTSLGAYKFSSKLVLVPIELLQDSAFDIGAFVAKALGIRIGRITNTYFTTGTGTSQPQGIVIGATRGYTTVASATGISYAEIKALEHSVDPAYRAAGEFMFHDGIALYLETLLDANNRPILISSLQGLTSGAVEGGNVNRKVYLLGYPVTINQDMQSTVATATKTMLFGDLSTFFVREVMDLMLVRFTEKYMDYGQVGFLCFYRGDSKALDAGTHPISYLLQK